MSIIEFKNVTFRYESDEEGVVLAPAVKDFSLNINEGDFMAILGHNGSGKSTLAKLANGLLLPESGTILVDGMDTKNEDDDIKIKQTVGVVFQNPDNQIVATIVEEDVAFGPENLGVEPAEIRRGNKYDIIIMDPPSYGRGPGGEVWKLENEVYGFVELCSQVLSDDPLMVLINSYTTGLSPSVMEYILGAVVKKRFGGKVTGSEIGLRTTENGLILPCGASAIWSKE